VFTTTGGKREGGELVGILEVWGKGGKGARSCSFFKERRGEKSSYWEKKEKKRGFLREKLERTGSPQKKRQSSFSFLCSKKEGKGSGFSPQLEGKRSNSRLASGKRKNALCSRIGDLLVKRVKKRSNPL